jgi:hypothetical protein
MRKPILFSLALTAAALAQNPEAGRVQRMGTESLLIVDGPRPVDSAAITLAQEFGIRLNVEDPTYVYRDDVKDVTANVSRAARAPRPVLIPKGGRLEVPFAVNPDGSPKDIPGLMQSILAAANAAFPFAYRLDVDRDVAGNWFTLVPTHTRNLLGQVVETTPLLDRRITIAPATRTIAAAASLMAEALSAQTGLRVSCCQSFVAGIPWGMAQIPFEAHDEPARSVLKRLITEAAINQPDRDYWLQRCDPLPSTWCFINLAHISRESPGPPRQPIPSGSIR